MHYLKSINTDPFFNIACEEFLFSNWELEYLFICINKPCVVVGKHQNANAEINHKYVFGRKIPVIRRMTGGGTVYHDEGNLNFTFITNEEGANRVDFSKFLKPLIKTLQEMGVPAAFGRKNEILASGLKISGNAARVYKNRVMHHGTVLFNTDLQKLQSALNGDEKKYKSKAVCSTKSPVANLSEFIDKEMDMGEFVEIIVSGFEGYFGNFGHVQLSTVENQQIEFLAKEKYYSPDWNYGYSPDYTFNNTLTIAGQDATIKIHVKKGLITEIAINNSIVDKKLSPAIKESLINCRHTFEDVLKKLDSDDLVDVIKPLFAEEFAYKLF